MAANGRRMRAAGKLVTLVAIPVALVLATSAVVEAALVSGSLPTSAVTYTATSINTVNMSGDIRLKVKDPISVKTTYAIVTPANQVLGGWHYHNGPVILTVTVGTLTLFDSNCNSWDVSAGQTYLETEGQILNAKAFTAKNTSNVEWFTTRLYPEGAADPVPVDAPCTP